MFLQPTSDREKRQLLGLQIGLSIGCLGLWMFGGKGSLLNSDDVLYAQMARESLENGSLVDHFWMGVTLFENHLFFSGYFS